MIDTIVAGRYRVLSLLGSGGMANVYKAYDEQTGNFTALKVLKEEYRDDPEFVRRFRREAQAVSMLNHPNIVRCYDVGEEQDIVYIALEYINGCSLKEYILGQGALPYRQAVRIAVQVLSALSCAHEAGIIHRDIKPQNVLLTQDGTAKLTDFGIARDAAATTRTFAGSNVIGSVHYLSPEQAKGEEVTVESDIYSCGIMLYEMLTGSVPFAGDNSVTIALKHLQEDVTPPDQLNSKIPHALSDVTVKAVSKNPEERYHSANAMRADLERALKEPHGRFASKKAAVRNNGKRHGMVGNILLAIVILLGISTAIFLGIRAVRESRLEQGEEYIVPKILGKKLDEAIQLAKLRGFELEVAEYAPSEEYPEGCVMSQFPESGTSGKPGDTISVTVSMGSEHTTVPNLVGMKLQEALNALADAELSKGEVHYVTSDKPDGEVLKQEPAPDTEAYYDDMVDLWVSGTADNSVTMPSVTELSLSEAVSSLKESGFERIWINFTTEEGAKNDIVLKQLPTAGMNATRNSIIELTVNRPYLGAFSSDIAFNVSIQDSQKEVVVTAKYTDNVEFVLYRGVMPVGSQQALSFTGYMRSGGKYECCLYIDGAQAKSNIFEFTGQ